MKFVRIAGLAVALGALTLGTGAQAQTWAQAHPRRAEVNGRLANQNVRIDQGLRDGQINRAQAHALRSDDHAIRTEERADASVNGGHVTRAEQRQMNQQENADSAAIAAARH